MFYQAAAGLLFFVLVAWTISENRKAIKIKPILLGIITQLSVAFILLKLPVFSDFFISLNRIILMLEESTKAGTSVVFGYLGGGALPFENKFPDTSFILAFRALPLVLVISALSSLLFYWKILPLIVNMFSWFLQKSLSIGGAEGLGVSANVFVGMVESPLLIRPYFRHMTRSEIFSLMVCGMATIAGTVMVLYASILGKIIPNIMGHILTASIISVPASITIARIIIPETEKPTSGELVYPEPSNSSMDAITNGTMQGIELLINIIAMLIVLVAIVHLINLLLTLLPEVSGRTITMQRFFGWTMAPVAWFMGIPWKEAPTAGSLLGTKTVLNELLAYIEMSQLTEGTLSPKSMLIMTYALCGFANPGSLGIMIGGMGTMAPERRNEIVSMGFRSIVAGTLATCMTGAIVGIIQ